MAPTEDDHYHPKDAVHLGLYHGMIFGGGGLLFAAVRNSLATKNVGPWTTFTKHGGIVATFGMPDSAYPHSIQIPTARSSRAVLCRAMLTCRPQLLSAVSSSSPAPPRPTCAKRTISGTMPPVASLRAPSLA